MAIQLNRKILLGAHNELKGQTPYGYGAKAEGGRDPRDGHRWNPRSNGTITTPISTIDNLDCSGYVRYGAYAAGVTLPDGSQSQRSWCEDNLQEIHYSDFGKIDNVLRIAFMTPHQHGVGSIGHVWWGFNARTMESYGGKGVGSHRWDVYQHRVSKAFIMPSISGVGDTIPDTTPKHDPPILVIHDQVTQNSYLANAQWYTSDGSLANILGYTTQTPNLSVNVVDAAFTHGWQLEKYTQRLNDMGRADMRFVKVA